MCLLALPRSPSLSLVHTANPQEAWNWANTRRKNAGVWVSEGLLDFPKLHSLSNPWSSPGRGGGKKKCKNPKHCSQASSRRHPLLPPGHPRSGIEFNCYVFFPCYLTPRAITWDVHWKCALQQMTPASHRLETSSGFGHDFLNQISTINWQHFISNYFSVVCFSPLVYFLLLNSVPFLYVAPFFFFSSSIFLFCSLSIFFFYLLPPLRNVALNRCQLELPGRR